MNTFPKANSFDINLVQSKIMGPNPLKLCEELLCGADLAKGSCVCGLGSGSGITSVMLAREYGLDVYAVDLWSDPPKIALSFAEWACRMGKSIPSRPMQRKACRSNRIFSTQW